MSVLHSVCILPFPKAAKSTAKNKKSRPRAAKTHENLSLLLFNPVLFILPLQLGVGLLDGASGGCKVWTSFVVSTGGDDRSS